MLRLIASLIVVPAAAREVHLTQLGVRAQGIASRCDGTGVGGSRLMKGNRPC